MTKTQLVDGAAIKKAIEGRDGKLLASFYTDDALEGDRPQQSAEQAARNPRPRGDHHLLGRHLQPCDDP
ncbi:hypothetical protein [Mesorhizobium abyssinicae]|uniref:hypothetical protein n=1 Tax=Mesorhizobium abyssinicae TaxID=1209958 RepID=UPI003CE77F3C